MSSYFPSQSTGVFGEYRVTTTSSSYKPSLSSGVFGIQHYVFPYVATRLTDSNGHVTSMPANYKPSLSTGVFGTYLHKSNNEAAANDRIKWPENVYMPSISTGVFGSFIYPNGNFSFSLNEMSRIVGNLSSMVTSACTAKDNDDQHINNISYSYSIDSGIYLQLPFNLAFLNRPDKGDHDTTKGVSSENLQFQLYNPKFSLKSNNTNNNNDNINHNKNEAIYLGLFEYNNNLYQCHARPFGNSMNVPNWIGVTRVNNNNLDDDIKEQELNSTDFEIGHRFLNSLGADNSILCLNVGPNSGRKENCLYSKNERSYLFEIYYDLNHIPLNIIAASMKDDTLLNKNKVFDNDNVMECNSLHFKHGIILINGETFAINSNSNGGGNGGYNGSVFKEMNELLNGFAFLDINDNNDNGCGNGNSDSSNQSYNLILNNQLMMIIPRKNQSVELKSGHKMVNGINFAGFVICENENEKQLFQEKKSNACYDMLTKASFSVNVSEKSFAG